MSIENSPLCLNKSILTRRESSNTVIERFTIYVNSTLHERGKAQESIESILTSSALVGQGPPYAKPVLVTDDGSLAEQKRDLFQRNLFRIFQENIKLVEEVSDHSGRSNVNRRVRGRP